MIKRILLVVLSIAILLSFIEKINNKMADAESISSEIVLDINSGRILFENNAEIKRPIASLTKILTAILVIENLDLQKQITIQKNCVGIEGSSVYLKEGEVYTIEHLLYGLMLRSGNDCAEALARAVSGSINAFATLMNKKAKSLGAENSNFVNPHGLHSEEHYSTARDLAKITAYAMKNAEFKKIVRTKQIKINEIKNGQIKILNNKNKLLYNFDLCTGVKTGYTKKAGRCLASSAKLNGNEVVSIVLNCGPMYEVSEQNIRRCFDEYEWMELCSPETFDYTLNLEKASEPCNGYIKTSFAYPIKKSEKNKVKIKLKPDKKLNPPLKKDEKIGIMEIYLENQLIFSQNIYTILDVEKKFDFSEPLEEWNIIGSYEN